MRASIGADRGVLLALVCVAFACFWIPTGLGTPPDPGVDQIFFSKSFPGSLPAYFEVLVDSAGNVSYREEPEEEDPLEFAISQDEIAQVFELARKLDHFRAPMASKRKVAFTGDKTLRYENRVGDRIEAQFTYSQNRDANAIVGWFEKVAETERHRIELERTVQFDRLGVNKVLLLFQISFDNGRIIGSRQFLPVLQSIANDEKFLHIARSRAASIVERIEGQVRNGR